MARMFKPLQRYFTFWQQFCSIAMLSSVAWRDDAESEEEEKTSQELRMLSTVTINCQITKIVMNSGFQLSLA